MSADLSVWPDLPLDAWRDTYATLHLWTQIVGKVRLAQTTWVNHSWHVTLYVTARGLSTSPIPHGLRTFEIEFDFIGHQLTIASSDGRGEHLPLEPQSVATFYSRLMAALTALDLPVRIHTTPNEIPDAIPFDRDETHRSYDREYAARFWRVLGQADRVLKSFRSRFLGKCSPVHFFWGAADLAVTRFSGRTAPEHPAGIPESAGLGRARSLLARSQQLWILGGWRPDRLSGLLLVCLSSAARVCRCACAAGRSVLQPGTWRVPAALRSRPACRLARRHAAGIPAVDLRGGGHAGELGSSSARAASRSESETQKLEIRN